MANGKGKMIAYLRVSTVGQREHGHSLPGQRLRVQEACAKEGLGIVAFIEDTASGASERDGLKEVQQRVMAGEAQGIVFPKVDRVGRSMVALLHLVEWAQANRVDLLSADEGWQVRDGKQVDKMLPFRLAMAQVELDRIKERTREGLAAARAKGIQLGRQVGNTGEVAQVAAGLRRQGCTIAAIVDSLNADGYKAARGGSFTPSSVYVMLRREAPDTLPEGGFGRGAG